MTSRVQIPGIELGAELGQGAHSIVYRALAGQRSCAVKLPKRRARWTRWIFREAVALARVRHRALPAIFEVGEVDGLPFLVMELVEGETLEARLLRAPLSEAAGLALAAEILGALAMVHEARLVHRDVKPSNIILASDGSVRLVDFGFATPLEHATDAEGAGTARYAAPEQLRAPASVDGRADLHALGRVLYEAVTGSAPTNVLDLRTPRGSRTPSSGLLVFLEGLCAFDADARYPDALAALEELRIVERGGEPRGPRSFAKRRHGPPLVGREDELRRLTRAVRARGGKGSVIFLRGGRGSGKSALLSAAAARAREAGALLLYAPCRTEDPPLAALRRIFEGFIAVSGRLEAPARELLHTALRLSADEDLAPLALLIAPSLATILGAPGTARTTATTTFAEGVAEIFLRLARRVGSLVVSIDDATWMDPASREVMVCLAHRCAEAPVALLFAERTDLGGELQQRFGTLDPQRTSIIELAALDERERSSVVATYLGELDMDPALFRRIDALANDTPLGLLEVTGAFLDSGALHLRGGRWQLDLARADSVVLPVGALAFLGRRLAELPAATRGVLETAAVIGTVFETAALARAVGLSEHDTEFAIAHARRAGLLEEEDRRTHRFLHDSLRETVLAALSPSARAAIHRAVAMGLEATAGADPDALSILALHLLHGGLEHAPARAARVARAAADAAFHRFDNETARRFYGIARAAQELLAAPLDRAFHQRVGEVELRLGELDASLAGFEAALVLATDAHARAEILGRIAWVHQVSRNPERAWETLRRAFAAANVPMPVENVGSVARTAGMAVRAGLRGVRPSLVEANPPTQAEIDLACDLYYQNARMGVEDGKPLRLLQSVIAAVELSGRRGPSRASARAKALSGFLLTAVGRAEAGATVLRETQELAIRLGDPVTRAFCVQIGATTAIWGGDFESGLAQLEVAVGEHGPWMEIADYLYSCANGDAVESLRGRTLSGFGWLERGLLRLRRTSSAPAGVADFYFHRVRAALAALGKNVADDPRIALQLSSLPEAPPPSDSYGILVSWAPRVRGFTEVGDLGPEFETLVQSFDRAGHNARTAHPALWEYYIAVAHARLHQCFRAAPREKKHSLERLRRAISDVRASAKMPVIKAHLLMLHGSYEELSGNRTKAGELLAAAETLGRDQSAPWILYGVARTRAHAFREAGLLTAARDQARIAEALAVAHGAEVRATWIREEHDLLQGATDLSSIHATGGAPTLRRVRRQLASLVQIVRSPTSAAEPSHYVAAILDDLLRDLDAERGSLWFEPDVTARAQPVFTRERRKESWMEREEVRTQLLESVRASREPWPPAARDPVALDLAPHGERVDPQRTLAVPLFLYDACVGALSLERDPRAPPFADDDREVLLVLAHQVPIALEIARLLTQREQLQTSLQHAQKMEAVGQLAGGVAHDFNNMLTVIQTSVETLRERADLEVRSELDLISEVAQRAGELTKQLLGFSRHRPLPLAPLQANPLLEALGPMIRHVLGERQLCFSLSPDVELIETDRASFEQAIVNLAVNARDAMPDGGTLTLSSEPLFVDNLAARKMGVVAGPHVVVSVRDTGQGMSPELRDRVFEPFFTTKPLGGGTGLGLTTVYTFMKGCGGAIDVTSEVGRGTTFRLFFPVVDPPPRALPLPAPPPPTPPRGQETVLVVDDDPLVARSIQKVLSRNGYSVLVSIGAADALTMAEAHRESLALAVIDVLMPGMSGPELGEMLAARHPGLRLLYVSGFAPEKVAQVGHENLLQKPFSALDLTTRVRLVLDAAPPGAGA